MCCLAQTMRAGGRLARWLQPLPAGAELALQHIPHLPRASGQPTGGQTGATGAATTLGGAGNQNRGARRGESGGGGCTEISGILYNGCVVGRENRMKRSNLILAIALSLLLGGSVRAMACTCSIPSTVDSWLGSSLIFVGTVAQMTPMTSGTLSGFTIVAFEPAKFWKGEADSGSITLLNPSNDGLCGYHFILNEEYLVYAETSAGNNGMPRTSICSRTTGYFEGHPDVPFLDSVVSVEAKSWSTLKKLYTD